MVELIHALLDRGAPRLDAAFVGLHPADRVLDHFRGASVEAASHPSEAVRGVWEAAEAVLAAGRARGSGEQSHA